MSGMHVENDDVLLTVPACLRAIDLHITNWGLTSSSGLVLLE